MTIISTSAGAITGRLAAYAADLEFEQIPSSTIDRAKQAILDLLGIAIRASAEGDSSAVSRRVVDGLAAPGKATAIGIGPHYQPQYAALLNGIFAHTLDFDDTHEGGSIHPGATVIPAALAIAEERAASGRRLLAAIVASYDVTVRLSEAAGAAAQYDRGFHPTATCGTFGATAAVANVAEAGAHVLENAFGINGSQAAGSLQFLENGAWNKRIHTGLAAHNAILAFRFAEAGALGAASPLEGRSGFFRGYTDDPEPQRAVATLGSRFAIDETAFKPYPSCRYSHAALDVLREAVSAPGYDPNAIESVTIGLPRKGLDLIGVPADTKRAPSSIVDGQFSMHFLAAVALLRGRMTWDDYELLGDPAVVATIDRIRVVLDPEIEERFPTMGASVEITTRGATTRRINWTPKGEPANPLGWDEVIAKFMSLATAVYGRDHCVRLVDMVRGTELLDDAGALTWFLAAPDR
ncbi:MAG: MmgE/PrpD family protein [Candidatus Eremiobacteraeota bacterium]|nr:MmgE/PrpD family protein [Candidatus Eremiobacteraeota bacterium]